MTQPLITLSAPGRVAEERQLSPLRRLRNCLRAFILITDHNTVCSPALLQAEKREQNAGDSFSRWIQFRFRCVRLCR